MLKLTVNPQTNSLVRNFDQKIVTIGSGYGSPLADLGLSDQELQSIHIKIMEDNHRYLAFNLANDPFVTLNGLPFGKKVIKNNDLLQIGQHSIHIAIESSLANSDLPDALSTRAENKLNGFSNKENPLEELKQNPLTKKDNQVDELTNAEIDSSKRNIQPTSLQTPEPEIRITENKGAPKNSDPPIPSEKEKKEAYVSSKRHLEYQLGEFDDENENWNTEKEEPQVFETPSESFSLGINWKLIGTITFSVLFIVILVGTLLYISVNTKNEDEEFKASEGIADIAMALKYAQIHHIKSQKKNWSDPEFIKNSLAQVIPHEYLSLAKIDPQGHLNDTSYSLRIYTSTSFSQFLVIAQPAPSVLQWLFPKTAIVIDSKLMQLRKVADIKALNRLLVNSNHLDNSNVVEVTQLVKRGELIPLSKLAKRHKSQDFSPPKALTLLRPGAENYIYNAPRYYQLGETIMKRAIDLMEMPGSAYEMARLKEDMSLLSKMHDMVLYSSDGIQLTLDAQKAIAAFVSNARFLTAYLKFNQEGRIISSQLIIDDEGSHYQEPQKTVKIAKPPAAEKVPEPLAYVETNTISPEHAKEDDQDPLLTQLLSLCASRKEALLPLKAQIIHLLNEDSNRPIDGLEIHLSNSIHAYLQVDREKKQEMAQTIHRLAEENQLMSLEDFIAYLNKAGLGIGCKEILKHAVQAETQENDLQNLSDQIKTAENFIDLRKILNHASQLLVVKNFNDLNLLHMSQKLVKNEAISRVNKLLLSSMPIPITMLFNEEQRVALQHVLQLLLENPDEQDYYLKEFERIGKGEE